MYLRWELAGTYLKWQLKQSCPPTQPWIWSSFFRRAQHRHPEWVSEPRHVWTSALIWEARNFVLTSILPWLTLEAGKCQYSKRLSWKMRPWTEKEVWVQQPKLCRITYLEVHAHPVCLEHTDRQDQQPHTCPTWRPPHPSCSMSRACSLPDALLTEQGVGLKFPSQAAGDAKWHRNHFTSTRSWIALLTVRVKPCVRWWVGSWKPESGGWTAQGDF